MAQGDPAPKKAESSQADSKRLYRHVVLFKFKEEAKQEQIDDIVEAFGSLQNEIDTIIGYEHGTDVSPEKLSKGFTHCFMVTFKSKADLDAYLPHPAHQAFTVKLKPILADVLVVDYWTHE
ncbi:Dabb family protein [Rubinisphaera margarita]|uniref:Dabb family protein n=1 Tax=Rubinisphaera margarita TaxID=2909586 RepID=UPI001EE960DB|nr:Dabb family protein [Rubinisphaera margarita]MCG6157847.1 Dabb family protein [Rubinisphaera margarita]